MNSAKYFFPFTEECCFTIHSPVDSILIKWSSLRIRIIFIILVCCIHCLSPSPSIVELWNLKLFLIMEGISTIWSLFWAPFLPLHVPAVLKGILNKGTSTVGCYPYTSWSRAWNFSLEQDQVLRQDLPLPVFISKIVQYSNICSH